MQPSRTLPRHDLFAILFSLGGVTVLAWLYLASMAKDMTGMPSMPMPSWDPAYFFMMFLMWAVMMVGMMVPSFAPAVLIYAAIARKAQAQQNPVAPTGVFVAGYLVMWVLFSLFATLAQWGLDRAGWLSPMMVANSTALGGGLLIAAGIYQWLPLKEACLKHCRSPVHFISEHWRAGTAGALRLGLHHGTYCLGCCWVLMGLLFVGGVMNLLWIAGITVFVLLEKLLPQGPAGGRAAGLAMIAAGVAFAVWGE